MKLITFFFDDGTTRVAAVVDDKFDTRTYLEERRHELMGVTKIEEQVWEEYTGEKDDD